RLTIIFGMMSKYEDYFHGSAAPGSLKNTKKRHSRQYRLSGLIKRFHTLKSLHILAGLCQLTLGMTVMVVAVLGLIHPVWLSTILGISAGVTAMTGIYFCHSVIVEQTNDTLLKNAMRRITEDQN